MPNYHYLCSECDYEFEIIHSMNATTPDCPKCNGKLERQIRACGIKIGTALRDQIIKNYTIKEKDMKNELREEYGVEQVGLTSAGRDEKKGTEQILKDVKERGNMVKEQMQASDEKNKAMQDKKHKAYKEKSLANVKNLNKLNRERKAKEKQKASIKKKISI